MFLTVGFGGAADGGGQAIAEGAAAGGNLGLVTAAEVGPASFFGGFDLFRGPNVGFGNFHFFFRARYLAFVPLG